MNCRLDVEPDFIWLLSTRCDQEGGPPFQIREMGHFSAKKSYCAEGEGRDDFLLLYTFSGQGLLQYGDREIPLEKGQVIIIDGGERHAYWTNGREGENWDFYWVRLWGEGCRSYYQALYPEQPATICCGTSPEIPAIFDRLFRYYERPHEAICYILSNFVSDILTKLLEFQKDLKSEKSAQIEAVGTAVAYIQSHFDQPIDVGELAAMVKLSKYYFIKLFKQYMMVTPYEYLLKYRINESKKMLLSTNYKAAEIGAFVGFADECNFSRTFKKFAGVTPIQYRKNA